MFVPPAELPYHLGPQHIFLALATGFALVVLLAVVTRMTVRYREQARDLARSNSQLANEIGKRAGTASELIRVNRSLLVLSKCNMAIVHARSEEDLLAKICQILVDAGGYRMAWIAYAGSDPAAPVKVAATAGGEGDYLQGITITWDDSPTGNGPTGTAIRTGRPSVVRHVTDDPAYGPWRERAARYGFTSSIALPVVGAHGLRGALNIYAVEEDAFDDTETALLMELAGDISYGVGALRSDVLRRKGMESLAHREEFLTQVLDGIRDGIVVLDADWRVVRGNPAMTELLASGAPLVGQLCCDIFGKKCNSCPAGRAQEERTRAREIVDAGDGRWLEIHAFPLQDRGVILHVRDVSASKRTEDDLVQERNKWLTIVSAMGEGLTIQDRDLKVVFQNDVHAARHGHHVGESCGEAYGCGEVAGCLLGSSFASGLPVSGESRLPSGEGVLDMEITASPLRDATGQIVAGIEIMRDISSRKRSERQIRKQLESISALRQIDRAITASGDLRVTFNVILNHVRAQLLVDAATVLLVNPVGSTLETAAAEGFLDSEPISRTCVPIGSGIVGKVAMDRRPIHISPLKPAEVTYALQTEGFVSYYAVPLLSKGAVTGVLELFHRSPFTPDSEWRSLAEAMAGQAAVAIDNARMFDSVQRANAGLIASYDATIAALSRALDFRDRETEGHSRRVTEMTVRIGREVNIADEELYHIRRGALLHDIGKLGIPDKILLKPAALDQTSCARRWTSPTATTSAGTGRATRAAWRGSRSPSRRAYSPPSISGTPCGRTAPTARPGRRRRPATT